MSGSKGQECGLYIIEDRYFKDFPSVKHMDNKHESRPYYLAIKDKNDIYWMVPISHKVEKYEAKIRKDEEKHGESIFGYIGKLKGDKRAFLTGNVIPVTDEYIRPFTVKGIPLTIKNREDVKKVRSKVSKYIALTRQGRLQPAVDILKIEKELLKK